MNATAFVQITVALIYLALMAWLSYYLGRRKTETPIAVGVCGFLLALIPPLALIYIAVLTLKKDITGA